MSGTRDGLAGILIVTALGSVAAAVEEPPVPAPPQASPAPARAGGQIRGLISYGRKLPAVGAVVVVTPEGTAARVYAATTGETGNFAFDGVADGTYRAEARREGYTTVVKSGIVVKAPFRAVVELVLVRGDGTPDPAKSLEGDAALTGNVRVTGGAPLAEARVRITRPDALDDPRTALTDATGGFAFDGLKAGRWRLELVGAGLLPLRADLDLAGPVVLAAALSRQPANYQPLPQDLIVPEDVIPPKE